MANDFNWLSNNLFISYPFTNPAPLVEVADGAGSSSSSGDLTDLANVFADAKVFTSDMLAERVKLTNLDLTLSWPSEPVTGSVTLEFEGGQVVTLDPAAADVTFRSELYGRWVVVEWVLDRTEVDLLYYPDGLSVRDVVCRFLLSRDFLEDYSSVAIDLSAQAAWLESSVIRTGPKRVRRMFMKAGDFLFSLGDPLRVEPGFNIELRRKEADDTGFAVAADETGRQPTTLFLDAVPAAGKGKYLRCLPVDFITSINGVGPDDAGEVSLDPIDCYWVEKPLATGPVPVVGEQVDETGTVEPHSLKLHNACIECCSCADYIRVYNNLSDLWDRAREATASVYNARDEYLRLHAQLTSQGAGATSVRVLLRSRHGFVMDISVLLVSGDSEIIPSQTLQIVLDADVAPPGASLVYIDDTGMYTTQGARNEPLDASGSWSQWTLDFSGMTIPANNSLLWQGSFRVADSTAPASFNVTAKLELDGEELASGTASAKTKSSEGV